MTKPATCHDGAKSSRLGESADSSGLLAAIIETQNDIAAVELEPQMVMQMIADRAARLIGAGGAAVELIEAGHTVCRAVSGVAAPWAGLRSPREEAAAGLAPRS